ncbi:MAG: 3'(2'),5'-bisphosphate nucleotidase CysQ, partial [Bdellovibrionota bacterium]
MIEALLDLAESAGKAIMAVRSSGQWTVQSKGDASPLTQADLAANAILMAGLTTLSSDPIVSEESLIPEITGSRFWLVDPLDGTKDFINGEETFVVCFALIESGAPVVSVVHAPVSGETWWATKNGGSFKRTKEDQSPRKISHPFPDRKLLAAGSRSIPSERMKSLYKLFGIERV